jgi:hypothetical protein
MYLTVSITLTPGAFEMAEKRAAAPGDEAMDTEARKAAARKALGMAESDPFHCSFCLKSAEEVKKLISGPGRIFICDECVDLCDQIIAGGELPKREFKGISEASTETLLARLKPIELTLQGMGNQLETVVEELRGREVSWARIGEALGVSRQSAWERFS